MSCICRTCLSEITSNRYVDINLSEFARKQLTLCIPELNLDLVLEPVLCMKCIEALNAANNFKSCCLQTEQRIHAHMQTLTIEQENVELDAVLGNNYNGINSIAMHCGNDITNDLNTVLDHSSTRHDLEDYKDAEGECSVTSENCSFDDGDEVNYDSFKEESIEIKEHDLDTFIKSEVLDTSSDAEITDKLRQWSEFENRFNLEGQNCNRSSQKQDIDSNEQLEDIKTELDTKSNVAAIQAEHNYAFAAANGAPTDDIFLPEPSSSDEREEHNESSGKTSRKSSGLLHPYSELDPMNCNANDENCNSATISAEASTKQGNSVTRSQVGIVSMEPNNNSSSVRLLRQRNVNKTKIADTSLIHSIKRRFKNISSIKSHSTTNNLCKRANRRMLYRCRQKEKNIEEKIVAKSELHSELLRDCRVVLTRMDISSAEEILNVANYAVMKGVETQVKNSSHLKCDMNINSNNTAATEAEADIHNVIDRSPLHQKHSNTSALNNSNTFTNVSLQNNNNVSVQIKNQELSSDSQFLNTTGEKPYTSVLSDNACSRKGNLIKGMRNHTEEKSYKCDQCAYAFSRKGSLIIHQRTHTGEKPYKCNVCNYASSQKSDLNKHLRTHTGEKPYKCNVCNYASYRKYRLNIHLMTHTGERPYYKCNVCNYASSQKSYLSSHLMTHSVEKPYKCNVCNYASSQKSYLSSHLMTHSVEKPYKCNVCNYASIQKTYLKKHLRIHTGEKPYKCNYCEYASSQKPGLNKHLRTHTGEKTYKCNVCNYASYEKSHLNIHLMTHTGERPYKCNFCNYASIQKCSLSIHLRTHTGEKPFKCSYCDYASSDKSGLNKHLRTHTGEKTYKCNVCNYASYEKSHLNIHLMTHTGERPYKCNVCNYAGSQKSELNKHLRTHTGEKPYKCGVCNSAFSQKSSLRRHMRKHSGEKLYKCGVCNSAFSKKSKLIIHMRKHSRKKII